MTDKTLTILGHFRELRGRVVRSAIAIAITTTASFIFTKQIFQVLTSPANGVTLIFIEPTEMIGTYMRVALAAGIAAAMPYLVYQFIMFVSPALTRRERRYVYMVLPWIAVMFLGGIVFAYFILLPPSMNFLLNFGSDIATPQIRIGNYISVVTRYLLAVGLVFELPVISTFLARIGVVTSKWLASKRRLAIILAFVLSALITPTMDPLNQTLVAGPLIVLYELSIWLAWLVQRSRSRASVSLPTPAAPGARQ